MRVYVQWAQLVPQGWSAVEITATGPGRRAWENLPSKPAPDPLVPPTLDNVPGWVHGINAQGVVFMGDHYAMVPIPGGVRVTLWNDDPVDWPPGMRHAYVWDILDPAPDDRFGGQVNTRQFLTLYGEQGFFDKWGANRRTTGGDSTILPWSDFVLPPAATTRHGVQVPDVLHEAHMAARALHGWREWVV